MANLIIHEIICKQIAYQSLLLYLEGLHNLVKFLFIISDRLLTIWIDWMQFTFPSPFVYSAYGVVYVIGCMLSRHISGG